MFTDDPKQLEQHRVGPQQMLESVTKEIRTKGQRAAAIGTLGRQDTPSRGGSGGGSWGSPSSAGCGGELRVVTGPR